MSDFLLPCIFKKITHLDCPGCGFQRSVVSLFSGDLLKSWQFYPPTSIILMTAIILLFDAIGILPINSFLKKWLLPFNLFLIGLNYLVKIILMMNN